MEQRSGQEEPGKRIGGDRRRMRGKHIKHWFHVSAGHEWSALASGVSNVSLGDFVYKKKLGP